MKRFIMILLITICVMAAALFTASCTKVEFNNPLDPKGDNYLYGDRSCEEEKITDYENGAGLFVRPELMRGCGDETAP